TAVQPEAPHHHWCLPLPPLEQSCIVLPLCTPNPARRGPPRTCVNRMDSDVRQSDGFDGQLDDLDLALPLGVPDGHLRTDAALRVLSLSRSEGGASWHVVPRGHPRGPLDEIWGKSAPPSPWGQPGYLTPLLAAEGAGVDTCCGVQGQPITGIKNEWIWAEELNS
ncbi:hypothetical protein THAOC_04916, partial [Thalassiosira oceanica]